MVSLRSTLSDSGGPLIRPGVRVERTRPCHGAGRSLHSRTVAIGAFDALVRTWMFDCLFPQVRNTALSGLAATGPQEPTSDLYSGHSDVIAATATFAATSPLS